MGQLCTVCSHPDAVLINEDIVGVGERGNPSNRRIAAQYDLSEQAIRRHTEHIPKLLLQASRAGEIAEADKLLDRILGHLEKGEQLEDEAAALGFMERVLAHRESRNNIRLLGEVLGKISSVPVLTMVIMNNPTWLWLQGVVIQALDEYPDARGAVIEALEAAERGELDE